MAAQGAYVHRRRGGGKNPGLECSLLGCLKCPPGPPGGLAEAVGTRGDITSDGRFRAAASQAVWPVGFPHNLTGPPCLPAPAGRRGLFPSHGLLTLWRWSLCEQGKWCVARQRWYQELRNSRDWSEHWFPLTRETKVGCPKDYDQDFGTSPILVQHAYHLFRYRKSTGKMFSRRLPPNWRPVDPAGARQIERSQYLVGNDPMPIEGHCGKPIHSDLGNERQELAGQRADEPGGSFQTLEFFPGQGDSSDDRAHGRRRGRGDVQGQSAEHSAGNEPQSERWRQTAQRYETEPETGEGRKELLARAKAKEEHRDKSLAAYHMFEYASAGLPAGDRAGRRRRADVSRLADRHFMRPGRAGTGLHGAGIRRAALALLTLNGMNRRPKLDARGQLHAVVGLQKSSSTTNTRYFMTR